MTMVRIITARLTLTRCHPSKTNTDKSATRKEASTSSLTTNYSVITSLSIQLDSQENRLWASKALVEDSSEITGTQLLQGLSAEWEVIKWCKCMPTHRTTASSPCSSSMARCKERDPPWLRESWSPSKWESDTGISQLSEEDRSSHSTIKDYPVKGSRCSRETTVNHSFNCQR